MATHTSAILIRTLNRNFKLVKESFEIIGSIDPLGLEIEFTFFTWLWSQMYLMYTRPICSLGKNDKFEINLP